MLATAGALTFTAGLLLGVCAFRALHRCDPTDENVFTLFRLLVHSEPVPFGRDGEYGGQM